MRHVHSCISRSVLVVCFGALAAIATGVCPAQMVNVLTFHNDNPDTRQNLGKDILTPQNVTSSNFGKLGLHVEPGEVLLRAANLPA